MRKIPLMLFVVLLFGMTLRLYPAIVSSMPFSTDAWSLVRNTELIMQNTPVSLNSNIFDGYDNFWPAIQLFGTSLTLITNLPPITAMAIGIPIASAFAIILFFCLVKKITSNSTIALVASLMLATAFSYTLYTAGVTKEAFASPLYMTLLFLFLLKHDKKTTILFSTTSVVLALTHHYTAFFATIILASLTLALYVAKNNSIDQKRNSIASNFAFTTIHAIITVAYFMLFASKEFISKFSSNMLLTVAAYQILFVSLTLWLTYGVNKSTPKRNLLKFISGSVLAICFMYTILHTCTLPGARLFYAVPLAIGLPLAVYGLLEAYRRHSYLLVPLFWLIGVLAFTFFAVFSNLTGGSDFTWRSMNFILPPLIILIAIGAHKLYLTPNNFKLRRFTKIVSALLILIIVTINSYGMYSTVSEKNASLGYFWLYQESDLESAEWLAMNAMNQTTAGDARVRHLLQYFDKPVSSAEGLRYLGGDGAEPEILYIYNQMSEPEKGYVNWGVPIILPENWTGKLALYNIIYVNNEVTIYARR